MAQTEKGSPKKKSDKPTSVKYIKMFVIDDLRAATIDEKVSQHIRPDATIISDASSSYTHFKSLFEQHVNMVIPPKQIGKVLPWVHIAISNAKRLFLNTFHNIQSDFLQNYLDEFCWKFNRRNDQDALFDRLLIASVSCKNKFRHNI